MKKIVFNILECFSEKVTHTTGEKASVSGVWRSGNEYIPLTKGERFPPSKDRKWNLVISL